MIRNIPNKYSQDLLLEELKNYKVKFDFFYLPIDYKVILYLLWVTLAAIRKTFHVFPSQKSKLKIKLYYKIIKKMLSELL